jgi:outer membrane protein assembly factor BamB
MRDQSLNRKKKIYLISIGLVILLGIGFTCIFVFFPHLLNKQWLVQVQYIEDPKNPCVVSMYQEISNSDDGAYLKGYWLYITDVNTGKEVNKMFIKRTDKNNDIPPVPKMYCVQNEIWLVGDKGIYQGDRGFLTLIKLQNSQLTTMPTEFLNGWNIHSTFIYNHSMEVVNPYNEIACLNMLTHQVDAQCPNENNAVALASHCFFFVKNTTTSTRGYLYFYKSSEPLPPAPIFAGYLQEGEPIPGWHLPDLVNMQRGLITKLDLTAYQSRFDSSETVNIVYNKELLNNPQIIFSDENICILTSTNEQNNDCYFYQFTSSGKLVWKVLCPALKKQTQAYGFNCEYKTIETIITHPMNWVISIDNSTGKIKWQYPK